LGTDKLANLKKKKTFPKTRRGQNGGNKTEENLKIEKRKAP
jgi:hypothetical protein